MIQRQWSASSLFSSGRAEQSPPWAQPMRALVSEPLRSKQSDIDHCAGLDVEMGVVDSPSSTTVVNTTKPSSPRTRTANTAVTARCRIVSSLQEDVGVMPTVLPRRLQAGQQSTPRSIDRQRWPGKREGIQHQGVPQQPVSWFPPSRRF